MNTSSMTTGVTRLSDSPEVQLERVEKENRRLARELEEIHDRQKMAQKENEELKERIHELIKEQEKLKKHLEKARSNDVLGDLSIEPKVYLKGMFDHYDPSRGLLCILISGKRWYYPLEAYQCAMLPVSGSRVFIFKSRTDEPLIYGFDVAHMLEPAPTFKAIVKAFSPTHGRLKLHAVEYGYFDVEISEELASAFPYRLGEEVLLKRHFIEGVHHFTFLSHPLRTPVRRDKILHTLMHQEFPK